MAKAISIDTGPWEQATGAKPKLTDVGDWTIQPPRALGKRPWLFAGMSYSEALRQAREKAGRLPIHPGDGLRLLPPWHR